MYSRYNNGGDRNRSRNNDRDSYRGGRRGGYQNDDIDPLSNTQNEPVTFKKNFYQPTKTMTKEEAQELRKSAEMRLNGNDINLPVRDFESLGFPQDVLNYFSKNGYTSPTPIQAQGWPMALSGRDMVGIAQTGSGKTISFMLPALIHAKNQIPLRKDDGPIVLVLAPTRELCKQIEEVASEYAPIFGLRTFSVYGGDGASINPQKRSLKRGVEILIATPGRLIDLHEQGYCPLNRVSFLVLDEADRMLDMGFEPQLNKIIPKTNSERQTLMWSATWPKEVRSLANNYMKDYIQVNIGCDELKANSKINQEIEIVDWRDKKTRLMFRLSSISNEKVIIFCNKIVTCDDIEHHLLDKRYKAVAIHGKKRQNMREEIINSFKNGYKNILIATDVAARGLDVKDVKMVINFDFPGQIEDYVHRIGRTARGSSDCGEAITFFTNGDSSSAKKLINILQESKQSVPSELMTLSESNSGYRQGNNRSRYRGDDRQGGYRRSNGSDNHRGGYRNY